MVLAKISSRRSPNADARPGGTTIDTLVLHYTGMRTAKEALDRLTDPASRVSAHYLIEEDGRIWQLVPEAFRAWHAGQSFWRGRTALNDYSIGVEIVNSGHEWGYHPFPDAQMVAVRELCKDLVARHPIPARNVVGHSDIAPKRKRDPGELFDWRGLAEVGIGLWPVVADNRDKTQTSGSLDVREALRFIGYDVSDDHQDLSTSLAAFQRHWRPWQVDAIADEETRARLFALTRLIADQ